MKNLFLLAALIISAPAAHADDISVVINGRTYQCGDGAGGQLIFVCECVRPWQGSRPNDWVLKYFKVNRSTGEKNLVRDLGEFDPDVNGVKCQQALQSEVLCNQRRN